jgi:soluble lytic murein transglycosylase-like protein
MAPGGLWLELEGPRQVLVRLATLALLAVGLILVMGWAIWDQNRLIATQQSEIQRLREHVRHLEERLGILDHIRSHRPSLPHQVTTALAHALQQEAQRYDLDWRLLLGIMRVESGFDPRARSPRGAVGLMQVMPVAFKEVAMELGWGRRNPKELEDPRVNIRVGAHYLSSLVRRFGDLEEAVQAYYLGPSRIGNPSDGWRPLGRQYLQAVLRGGGFGRRTACQCEI